MFALYQRFVQQLKQEEIKKYNEKHRDYLVRCGKIKESKPQKQNMRMQNRANNRSKRQPIAQENIQQTSSFSKQPTIIQAKSDERPLKGANTYNFEQQAQDTRKTEVMSKKNTERQVKIENNLQKDRGFKQKQNYSQKQEKIQRINSNHQTLVEQKFKNTNNPPQIPEQFQQIVLVECPQGCGKKFKQSVLEKHIKLCQKGEKKRKVFKVKLVDEQAQQLKKDEPKQQQKKSQVPKWKKQSNQLRNVVSQIKNQSQGVPAPPVQEQDDRKQCPGCGRKFNEKAAEKHIPGCVQRNKGKK